MTRRELVVIVGPGRSGTSVLASILAELGYTIPGPHVPSDETNPRGFAEPQWLIDFHAEILRSVRVQTGDARPEAWGITAAASVETVWFERARAWLDLQLANEEAIVLKDPRALWFTGLWDRAAADVGAEISFVTMLRRPADAVKSRDMWYQNRLDPTNRAAGWVNTMLLTERATRGRRRGFVFFDQLMGDWAGALGSLDKAIGLSRLAEVRVRELRHGSEVIEPGLNRSSGTNWDELGVSPAISGFADELFQAMQLLVVPDHDRKTAELNLDAMRGDYRALYATAEAIAQSSILAVGRGASPNSPTERSGPPPPPGRSITLARVIPEGWRHAVPLGMRKRVLRLLP